MVQYFTYDGILMDYSDFFQFWEYKINFDSWDNVEFMRVFLDSFDEYAIDLESWNVQKQLLVEKFSLL